MGLVWKHFLYVLLMSVYVDISSLECDGITEKICEENETHHCLFDAIAGVKARLCALPVLCSAGSHAVLDNVTKTVTCEECTSDMYQPEEKWSNTFTQSNCDYRVTLCNEQQVVCENATSTQNNKCACDHTAGYKPDDTAACKCFPQDLSVCGCVKANCKDEEVLTEDFDCVQDDFNRNYNIDNGRSRSKAAGVAIGFAVIGGVFIIACVIMFVYKSRKLCSRANKDAVALPIIIVTDTETDGLQT